MKRLIRIRLWTILCIVTTVLFIVSIVGNIITSKTGKRRLVILRNVQNPILLFTKYKSNLIFGIKISSVLICIPIICMRSIVFA